MEWMDLLIDVLVCSLAALGGGLAGFVTGGIYGYLRGRRDVQGYYSSYRAEDAEIIGSLRENAKNLIDRNCLLESNITSVIDQLRRTQDDK